MGIILYISGIITALSLVAAIYYRGRYGTQQSLIKKLTDELIPLREYKSNKESKKRKARFNSTGWYKVKDEDDPNKFTWDVTFELVEVAKSSTDENKVQFKVVDIYSECPSEQPMTNAVYEHYESWFLGNSGGGWLSTKNKDFEWINTTSVTEIRDDKLDELGIK